jgi:chloride channel 3/4/5
VRDHHVTLTWSGFICQIVRDVEAIRLDRTNTVRSLRDQLQAVVSAGGADAGFPILSKEPGGLNIIGYIGVTELEYALSEPMFLMSERYSTSHTNTCISAIVADDADAICHFHSDKGAFRDTVSTASSYREYASGLDPFDFTVYMNHVCPSASALSFFLNPHLFFPMLGSIVGFNLCSIGARSAILR